MLMPVLTKGGTYKWTDKEIVDAIAPDDRQDFKNSQCRPNPPQPNKELVLEYAELSVEDLRHEFEKLRADYIGRPCDLARVEKIKTLIQGGEKACPFFIDKNDATRRIQIGNHRAVAFFELSISMFPVLLYKYAQ